MKRIKYYQPQCKCLHSRAKSLNVQTFVNKSAANFKLTQMHSSFWAHTYLIANCMPFTFHRCAHYDAEEIRSHTHMHTIAHQTVEENIEF